MRERVRGWCGRIAAAAWLLGWSASAGAEEAAREGGGIISLDRSLIVQAINFLVLMVVLWKLLYRPLVTKMEERTAAIKNSLDQAQLARTEAQRQLEENAARLRQAYAEAQAIRDAAQKEAAEQHRKVVEAARHEAQRLVDGARAELESEVRRARADLRNEVGEVATAIAEKLIRTSLRDEDHRRIVAEAVRTLEGRAS
jgi:F-type H+-transporting ATPase subunit b